MAVKVENLLKEKFKINKKGSKLEKKIDLFLVDNFKSLEKMKYIVPGKDRMKYNGDFEKIIELYQNAGWNVEYKKSLVCNNYYREVLTFNIKE